MESTAFMTYFDSIVSTINGSMTEEPTESTILSTSLDSTTASGLMCPKEHVRCGEINVPFCINGGICCLVQSGDMICVCPNTHRGDYCDQRIYKFENSRLIMERAKAIAAFSAVLGVFVIALFLVLIAFQIKYYRYRKKRMEMNDHEMDVIPRPPGSGPMINQPGYSWRQSIRRTSKVIQKLQGPSSRSVPDDLFKMGVAIALFNLKADELKNKGREEGGGRAGGGGEGGGGVGPDSVGRCFSAGAGGRGGGGGGSTVSFGPKTALSPTSVDNGQERVPLTRTEDLEAK